MADRLTPRARSRLMSRIRSTDTGIERLVRSALHLKGLRFRKHPRGVPGKPDIVFGKRKIAVFIDGDFWHGFNFPHWERTLPEFWRKKIELNRRRDRRTFAKLRRTGWTVLRVWEHEIESDLNAVVDTICAKLGRDAPHKRAHKVARFGKKDAD